MNLNQAVALALGSVDRESRLAFARDPLDTLRQTGISVEPVPSLGGEARGDGGSCDGVSFLKRRVIQYAPSPYSRRQNFTLAHEYGHFLVDKQDSILNWLGDLPNTGRALETVCDRIASELLLPKSLIDQVIGGQEVPRADHLLALYEASSASEPCCGIALASRLRIMGAVVIADRNSSHTVLHASIRPGTDSKWPEVYPWRGETLPPEFWLPPGRDTASGYLTWTDHWGREAGYYADACVTKTRVHLVLAEIDLWNSEFLHVRPTVEPDHRPTGTITCCGQTHDVRGFPCNYCGQPYCPKCKRCHCDRENDRAKVCIKCRMSMSPNLVNADGVCVDCQ